MATTGKEIIVKYECSSCHELHDHMFQAEECCQPEVGTVYVCPVCDEAHESRKEAEDCLAGHAELIGELPEHCPNCLREAETAQLRVEISIAGHCSTCNPIYTPEENIAIKYTLEPRI